MNRNPLTSMASGLCLALMVALMVDGEAGPIALALVCLGAGLMVSACLFAERQ